MGLLGNVFKGNRRYSRSFMRNVTQSAEELYDIVNEAIQQSAHSNILEEKKARLEFAMTRLVELIKMANEYPFLDFRKISSIYDSIRDVRNDIKEIETALFGKPGKQAILAEDLTVSPSEPAAPKTAEQSFCPYCSYHFPVMPQRRTACPSCNKIIYVWYSATDNIKKLITREEANHIEKEVSENIEKYELLNKQETLEKSEEEMHHIQAELKIKDPTASLDDAYLFLLNNKIKNTGDPGEKSRLHYLKAMLLDSSGEDFFNDLYECRKQELINLESHGILKKVQVITGPDACHVCKSGSDKVYTLAEALETMPIPHPDCVRTLHGSRGFCRCTYLVVNT